MDGLWRFVAGQLLTNMVFDALLVECSVATQVHDGDDGLAPFFTRHDDRTARSTQREIDLHRQVIRGVIERGERRITLELWHPAWRWRERPRSDQEVVDLAATAIDIGRIPGALGATGDSGSWHPIQCQTWLGRPWRLAWGMEAIEVAGVVSILVMC